MRATTLILKNNNCYIHINVLSDQCDSNITGAYIYTLHNYIDNNEIY